MACSLSTGLLRLSCRMGTDEASYFITFGGIVPGGRMRSSVWQIAVTCATAMSILTLGWKYNRMIDTPL